MDSRMPWKQTFVSKNNQKHGVSNKKPLRDQRKIMFVLCDQNRRKRTMLLDFTFAVNTIPWMQPVNLQLIEEKTR